MASQGKKIFKCDFFSPTYISGLDTLRQGNHLNDIVLNVQGREFSCHKLVLAANSKYFLTMFTADFNTRNRTEIQMPPEIAPEAMETLLEYFYSGELELSQSNIAFVCKATDYMRLEPLLEICIEYMQETLDLSNSVQYFVLADTIQHSSCRLNDLKKASSSLIVSGVEKICRSEDFLNLSPEHISEILNSNNQPTMAESLYWVILKWVSHDEETRKQYLFNLLNTLPVEGISDNFLTSKIKTEELLRRDSKSILWVMDYAMSRLTTISLIQSQPSLFFVMDRCSSIQNCFLVTKVDDPSSEEIYDRPDIGSFSAASYKKRIYLFSDDETEKTFLLDDPHEPWVDCHLDLKFGRKNGGCVVLGDDLYIVGGWDLKNKSSLNSCMKFNFNSGQKQYLPSMRETRDFPGVAVYANSLYAACGSDASPSIERFDPREGRWCSVGRYATKFGECSATTVAHSLYCCCRLNATVERFDYRINRSQLICSLSSTSARSCWISSVENELLGARYGKIFVYDALTDKWNDFCCAANIINPLILPCV